MSDDVPSPGLRDDGVCSFSLGDTTHPERETSNTAIWYPSGVRRSQNVHQYLMEKAMGSNSSRLITRSSQEKDFWEEEGGLRLPAECAESRRRHLSAPLQTNISCTTNRRGGVSLPLKCCRSRHELNPRRADPAASPAERRRRLPQFRTVSSCFSRFL